MAISRTKKTPQKRLPKLVQLPQRYAAFGLGAFIAALELVAKNWVTLVSGSRDGRTLFGEVKASATVKRRVMLRNGGAQAGPEAQISGDCSCGEAWCAHLCALALWVEAQAKEPADEKQQRAAQEPDPEAHHSGTNGGTNGGTNAGANTLLDQRRLVFLLRLEDDLGLCRLLPYVELQDTQPDRQRFFAYQPSPFALTQAFLREQDQAWLSALQASGYRLGADQARQLEAILEAGRCFHGVDSKAKALQPGPVRAIRHAWRLGADAVQRVDWQGDRDEQLFLFPAPWYLDAAAGLCGPADTGLAPRLLELFTRHARILPEHLAEVRQAMLALMPEREPEIKLPQALEFRRLNGRHPNPVLRVGPAPKAIQAIECHLLFRYQGLLLPDTRTNSLLNAGEVVSIERDARAEAGLLGEIQHLFAVHPQNPFERQMTLEEWQTQGPGLLQRLRGLGWEIQQAADFEHRLLLAEDWRLELVEPDAERPGLLRLFCWHQVPGQGGELAGDQRLDLLPLLRDNLAARHPLLEPQRLCLQPSEGLLALRGQGQLIAVPAGLVKGLIDNIFELQAPARDAEAGIPLSLARAASLRLALEALPTQASSTQASSAQESSTQPLSALPAWVLGWQEPKFLAELCTALQQKGQGEAQLPVGLECELRPYQRQGLAWLQLLARHGLGGILADDMGLGKTLQCLALVLWYKHQGPAAGLTGPTLVVAPKSLLGNWRAEARRFAPGLRVLVLDGPQRHLRFGEIPGQDLVVTSYPLVSRDQDALARQYFRALVLDESQWIKNPASQTAQAVRRIQAGHRLCLTGTPLENHLGELWAQFDFLMPGFLGGPNLFQRLVRDPIEKWGDADTNQRLGRRLGPFMLRRTKAEVLPELPPKTEIPRYLDMGEDQQGLYEQIRRHIYPELKEKLATQGLKGNSISILDALLKLRQVCCDPRLVKGLGPMMSQAMSEQTMPGDTTSIKLDYLRELLPELVAEGRRILLFSQFTSMLALIEAELGALQIPHLKLTGQSRQRDELVAAFQRGEAPVFLISLKAGGTGLNLTAADTIIHYDPWWNPAIERQATDRAYRIGQDKPVFVYKLLCTGSVETRIQELQARKEALADNLLDASEGLASRWNEQDIDYLFAPLDRL